MKKTLKERYKELKEFSLKVKRLARGTGRSMKIDLNDFEQFFVRYNITLESLDDELKNLENEEQKDIKEGNEKLEKV